MSRSQNFNCERFALFKYLLISFIFSRLVGFSYAAVIDISNVDGTGFVQGGTATVTGSVESTGGALSGVNFQVLDEESQGTESTTFLAGTRDESFASGNGGGLGASSTVYTSAIQIDGKILIGGDFTTYNGTSINRVARLNIDGSLDTSFVSATGANSTVRKLAIQSDEKIVIVGEFSTYKSTSRQYIARLNSDGSLDTTFDPGSGANGPISTLAIQSDGKILIGGSFSSYRGTSRSKIARINSDGTLDTSFDPGTGTNSTVYTAFIQTDGKIVIGGGFVSYNGVSRNYIARLNSDGSLDTSFDPGTGANEYLRVSSFQSDGKILIAGSFTSYNGTARNYIARLNSNGSLDTSFDPGTGPNSSVHAITNQSDGKILIGGYFASYNGTARARIARLNSDGSLDTAFDPSSGANDVLYAINIQSDGKAVIAGQFTTYNSIPKIRITRLHTYGAVDSNFNPWTGANSTVYTAPIQTDGKVIIGGDFILYNGVARNRIARLNTDGSLDTSFDPGTGANGTVWKSVIQTDGKIIISGYFTTYNGTSRNYIARLNTDGSFDTDFNMGTGANNYILAILIQTDGKILIAGGFSTYNGTTRNGIARLNSDGSLDTSFNPGLGTSAVYTSAFQSDGKILIGGFFTSYSGTSRNYIARVNTDGSLDTTFDPGTGANGNILTLATQSDDKILIAGGFTSYNGTTRKYFARLNPNGTLDTTFDPGTGANSAVHSLAAQDDGKVLIGGSFTLYDETARNRIARVNTDGSLDASFDVGAGAGSAVWALLIRADGKILVGGSFTSYNGNPANYLLVLHASPSTLSWEMCTLSNIERAGKRDASFVSGTQSGNGANSIVRSSTIQVDGKIIIGGDFATYNNIARRSVARVNTDGSLDATFDPGYGANDSIRATATQTDGKIIIAGQFTDFNGIARSRIARLNTNGTLDTSFDPGTGANAIVYTISVQADGKILIGGNFTLYNGTTRNSIARLNTDGTLDTSFDPGTGANTTVWRSTLQADGKILIGGNFTTYNGTARKYVARVNTNGSLDTSFDPGTGASSYVYEVSTQSDGKIIIGGNFATYNGTARSRIARLNTNGSLDTSFDPGTGGNNSVWTIFSQSDGKIFISGLFTLYNGTVRNRVARLNANGSLDSSFDPGTGTDSAIYASPVQGDGKIVIGGQFTAYNGVTRGYIARLTTTGSLDTSFDRSTGPNRYVNTFVFQSDGKILIGGSFTTYNGTARSRIARINVDGSLDTIFDPGTGADNTIETSSGQSDGKILIGGQFTMYNGIQRNGIARLNSDGSLDASFVPGTGTNGMVRTSSIQSDGKIIIGGEFTTYNGAARNRIARLNTDGSLDTSFDPETGADSNILASFIQADGKIIIGGQFTTYNGTARNRIARLNTNGSLDTSFDPGTGADGIVHTSATQTDGKILIGGRFTSYNGTARNRIARINTDGSLDTSFYPGTGASDNVYTSAVQTDGRVIVGGDFGYYNGTTRSDIARINTDGSLDTSFDPGTGSIGAVFMTAIQSDGRILIGGSFTTYNSEYTRFLVRIDTRNTADFSCTVPVLTSAQGHQSVYIRTTDSASNILTELYQWMIDTKQPSKLKIALDKLGNYLGSGISSLYTKSREFTLYLKPSDKYSDISYMKVSEHKDFRGAKWRPYDGDIKIKLEENKKTKLYIKIKDEAGNVSDVFTQTVYVDTISPILTLEPLPVDTPNPTLTGTTEEGSFVKVWVNSKVYGQDSSVPADGKWEVSKTNLLNDTDITYGNNVISIETEDRAGNKTITTFEHYLTPLYVETPTVLAESPEPIQVLAAYAPEVTPPAEPKPTTKATDYIRYAVASIITLLIIVIASMIKQKATRITNL